MPTQKLITNFFGSRVSTGSSAEGTAAIPSPADGHRMKGRVSRSQEALARAVTRSAGLTSSPQADLVEKVIPDSDDESGETLRSGRVIVDSVKESTMGYPKPAKTRSNKMGSSQAVARSAGLTSSPQADPVEKVIPDSDDESSETLRPGRVIVDSVKESTMGYPKPAKTRSNKTEPIQVDRVIPDSDDESGINLQSGRAIVDFVRKSTLRSSKTTRTLRSDSVIAGSEKGSSSTSRALLSREPQTQGAFTDSEDESGSLALKAAPQKKGPAKRTLRSGRRFVDSISDSTTRSSKTLSKKTESIKATEDYESELELDTSKTSIDETLTSLTSFAETPAKEADTSKIALSLPTPTSLGPQRPRRSAAAAAEASIKRSYEEYGQSLAEVTEVVKKARRELPAITLAKIEADDNHQASTSDSAKNRRSSGRASARVARSKGKASASLASSHASLDEDDSEAELPVSDYEDAVAVHNRNDSDGDWDEESQGFTVGEEELGDEFLSHDAYDEASDDESNDALDEIELIDLIDDDEYIAFENEDESNDDVPHDDVAESGDESDTSEPLHKKSRVVSSNVNAAKWLADYNTTHPVESDDEDLMRFNRNFTDILKEGCHWSTEGDTTAWYKLPKEKRETAIGTRVILQKGSKNLAKFSEILLEGIPQRTRKILGKKDLSAKDLLDLPIISSTCKHRLVYLDITTRVGEGQIRKVKADFRGSPLHKEAKPSCDLKQASQVKLYIGSSVNKIGGSLRIKEHLAIINGYRAGPVTNMHYTEATKADVVPNFRLLGVWQNPYADGSYDGQDVSRWIPSMVEGLMMVYLGLYSIKHTNPYLPMVFPLASYDLAKRMRDAVSLPDFADISLNRAWPLCQVIFSSRGSVKMCANPECRRPGVVSVDTLTGTKPTNQFLSLWGGDLLTPFYCFGCYTHYRRNGSEMRTRKGLLTGRWDHETDFDAINKAWLGGKGRQRKCGNIECGVPIHNDANLYGIENGIRCMRCHTFALSYHKEYSRLDRGDPQTGDCQVCHKKNALLFSWTQIHKLKKRNADLPSEICGDCYSIRCSFLRDDVPMDAHSKTIAACGNPSCWDFKSEVRQRKGHTVLIENINENVWRCGRCDYCHEVGIDSLIKKPNFRVPKPPIGPIPSHRFNATSCIDCERYISYRRWEKVEGGYRCASCVGRKCADCAVDPALALLIESKDGQFRCVNCYTRHKRLTPIEIVESNGLLRKCCNSNCNATTTDRCWFKDPEDKSLFRCGRCNRHFIRHGTDWYPPAKCYNESCDAAGADVPWSTCSDGNVRCMPCRGVFTNTGKERDCRPRCHNYDHCKKDYTNYSGKFCLDRVDGNTRCFNCHFLWVKGARQFEVGALIRLTKAQREVRICSRPGCNRSKETWGQLHRWKEFIPDGWVCDPCFKELKAQQESNAVRGVDPATAGDPDEDAVAGGDAVVEDDAGSEPLP